MTPSPTTTVKQPASKPTADSTVVASDTLPRSKVRPTRR